MKQRLTAVFLCIALVLSCSGCTKYRASDFIGKTSAEIISEFGEFDCTLMPAEEDGVYRNCQCGYTVREPRKGFLGTSPEILFFILFDENGVAVSCEEGYRPGG